MSAETGGSPSHKPESDNFRWVRSVGENGSIYNRGWQRTGKDWDYVDCNMDMLLGAYSKLETELSLRFSSSVEEFDAENGTAHHIKAQRVKTVFSRRIAQDEQRLQTIINSGREASVLRMAEGRLRVAKENLGQRLSELNEKSKIDIEQTPIAAGVFRVMN